MSFSPANDFAALSARGLTNYDVVHKFGRNSAVGTSFVAISLVGNYQMPTTAQALEIISSDANDTAAGTGARVVTVQGLDANWAAISQDVPMNGTTAAALTTNMTRLYRAFVKESGTYATGSVGSHAGDITIRAAGGGASWSLLSSTDYARAQSELGAYSVPAGKSALVRNILVSVDSNKFVDVLLMHRAEADVVIAPYGASRIVFELGSISGERTVRTNAPFDSFAGPCDLYFLGKVSSGTTEVDVDFEIWLYDT